MHHLFFNLFHRSSTSKRRGRFVAGCSVWWCHSLSQKRFIFSIPKVRPPLWVCMCTQRWPLLTIHFLLARSTADVATIWHTWERASIPTSMILITWDTACGPIDIATQNGWVEWRNLSGGRKELKRDNIMCTCTPTSSCRSKKDVCCELYVMMNKLNGSHLSLPPSSIHRRLALYSNFAWTVIYRHWAPLHWRQCGLVSYCHYPPTSCPYLMLTKCWICWLLHERARSKLAFRRTCCRKTCSLKSLTACQPKLKKVRAIFFEKITS